MPKKTKITKPNIKTQEPRDDDTESFHNSEEDYAASEEASNNDNELSGGDNEPDASENELADDSGNLEIDPDDQGDPDRDEKYDPINDTREEEDPEDADDREDPADYESAGSEAAEQEAEVEAEETDGVVEGEDGYVGETKQCHLKNLNKDFILLDEDDSNMYGKMEYKRIAEQDRETDAIMTYYEMVRIIGTRAQQFNFGAKPLVKGLEGLHPAKKAYVELISRMTPFIIRRNLPGKKYEEWRVDELEIIHKISDSMFVPENFDYNSIIAPNQTDIDITSDGRVSGKKTGKNN